MRLPRRRDREPERPLPGLADRPDPRAGGGYPSPPEPVTVLPVVRPHPAANAWPDDAVTVTYAELRRLVALHLELCSSTMPGDAPWDWMRLRAAAVRDGEAPLLLSEVMEP